MDERREYRISISGRTDAQVVDDFEQTVVMMRRDMEGGFEVMCVEQTHDGPLVITMMKDEDES